MKDKKMRRSQNPADPLDSLPPNAVTGPSSKVRDVTAKQNMDAFSEALLDALWPRYIGYALPVDIIHKQTGKIIVPAGRKMRESHLRKLVKYRDDLHMSDCPDQIKIFGLLGAGPKP